MREIGLGGSGSVDPADTVAAPAGARCPACGEPLATTDRFCEQCGRALDPAAPAAAPAGSAPGSVPPDSVRAGATAGAPAAGDGVGEGGGCRCPDGRPDADGYCDNCGTLVRAGRRDECRAPAAALVSDPGLVHARNEDAGVVGETNGSIFAVVCDGVSSAPQPDAAARAAVGAASEALCTYLRHPTRTSDPDPDRPSAGPDHASGGLPDPGASRLAESALRAAAAAAAAAVGALAGPVSPGPSDDVPACTFVAAVLHPAGSLQVAHAGDSRAYWLPDDGRPRQLTVDDSWATDAIRGGGDPALVWADRRAHTLTGWLGADSRTAEPHLGSVRLAGPGLVVLCSDGLWNYLPDLADFADRVRWAHRRAGADPLGCARLLVDFARGRGGRDNITVAVLRHGPAPATGGTQQPVQPDHARAEEEEGWSP
jgi:serine/threonine protein phosphatase PrpC